MLYSVRKIPISIRIDPLLKKAAEKSAKMENRSFTNLIETLLLESCRKNSIKVQ